MQRSTLEIAATWLAAGLPDSALLYRQSDIPEVLELAWLLACTAGKGLLNRGHARQAVDRNLDAAADPDAGINMGLFLYRATAAERGRQGARDRPAVSRRAAACGWPAQACLT